MDPAGVRIAGSNVGLERLSYQLDRLVGLVVTASEVAAPGWFALRFNSGEVLRIYDNSEQYESFSIQPGNIFV